MELAKTEMPTSILQIISSIVLNGDMSKMNEQQKVDYYIYRCKALAIDPASKPFDVLNLNGKIVLYANKSCTDQLCLNRGISRHIVSSEVRGDIYIVVARATDASGRSDESTGAVSIKGLGGDALANAIMKTETKAKRRAVHSFCGTGMLDESEIETIQKAKRVDSITIHPKTIDTEDNIGIEAPPTVKVLGKDVPSYMLNTNRLIKRVSEVSETELSKKSAEDLTIMHDALLNNLNKSTTPDDEKIVLSDIVEVIREEIMNRKSAA